LGITEAWESGLKNSQGRYVVTIDADLQYDPKDIELLYETIIKVAKGIVPDEIIERIDKKGLITPIEQWFSNDLNDWTSSLAESFKKRKIEIKHEKRRVKYDRYLYALVSLELWYQMFIDAKSV